MNNRFGDSRQRFSIRKFTVGVASVLLSSAVFGVSTAKADQAEEPTGQPASVLEKPVSLMGKQRTTLVLQVKK
ncbi:MAG: YSIRK-type signal peptide-containing protein [Streptococcus salivarius]